MRQRTYPAVSSCSSSIGVQKGRWDTFIPPGFSLLSYRSPLFDHSAYGKKTWKAELTSVDDDSLGKPSFDDASKGYRIWLLSCSPKVRALVTTESLF